MAGATPKGRESLATISGRQRHATPLKTFCPPYPCFRSPCAPPANPATPPPCPLPRSPPGRLHRGLGAHGAVARGAQPA